MSKKRNKAEAVVLITATIVSVLAAVILFLRYTQTGKRLTAKAAAMYLHGAVNYVADKVPKPESVPGRPWEGTSGTITVPVIPIGENQGEQEEPIPTVEIKEEERVIHILLLGEEAIHGGARTDSILLVSVHPGQKKVHVTSILRDTYVEPEGMYPCKINAVYAKLGVAGLYQLLYEKLGVWPDGYAKVTFESFEEIIDLLGGADVTLTKEEADYLNTHNYISKPEYRNVVAGTQRLNGNQTLGYCRVRYVANCNGTANDYGRTERQRMVLNNLFQRYKEAGVIKWVTLLNKCLGGIETDLDEKTMEDMIYAFDAYHIKDIVSHQLPAKGTFSSKDRVGTVTATLVADWEKNRELFWSYLENNQ